MRGCYSIANVANAQIIPGQNTSVRNILEQLVYFSVTFQTPKVIHLRFTQIYIKQKNEQKHKHEKTQTFTQHKYDQKTKIYTQQNMTKKTNINTTQTYTQHKYEQKHKHTHNVNAQPNKERV